METKSMITAAIVVAAIAAAYVIFSGSAPEPAFMKEKNVTDSVFVSSLMNADTVYLVQDLRGASAQERTSIQQCSVDFAGSPGLVSKSKIVFAFEDSNCVDIDNAKRDIGSCISELEGKTVIYVWKGNETRIFRNALLVGLGTYYQNGSCSVNVAGATGGGIAPSGAQPTEVSGNMSDILDSLVNES